VERMFLSDLSGGGENNWKKKAFVVRLKSP
jgi:hypothetical protein